MNPETTPATQKPLLRLFIFLIVTCIAALLTSCGDNSNTGYQAYDSTYYNDYTISSAIIRDGYADITICLNVNTVETFLAEMTTSQEDSCELPEMMLPTGHSLTIGFPKFYLQEVATVCEEEGFAGVGIHSEVKFDVPAPPEFLDVCVFILLPQDLEYLVNTMTEENLDAYDVSTTTGIGDSKHKLHLSFEEAYVYLKLMEEYGARPIVVLPVTSPSDPIIIELYDNSMEIL